MQGELLPGIGACLLLVGFSAAGAAIMRAARCPGAAIVGGILAGIILGPSVLGRAWPAAYEHVFAGGVGERETRDAIAARYDLDIPGFTLNTAQHDAMEAEREGALEPAQRAWEDAKAAHQRPLRVFVLALVSIMLVLSGRMAHPAGGQPPAGGSVMSIGGWSAILPGAGVFLVLHGLLAQDLGPSLLAAGAAAIGPYVLSPIDRSAADRAEIGGCLLVQTAGRVASLVALAPLLAALWLHGGAVALLMGGLPLLALPAGWLLRPRGERAGERARALVDRLLVPALAASTAVTIELFEHTSFWPILTLLVASGDGRWLGASIGGVIAGGRPWLRTMRLVIGSMSCGPAQLAVAAVAAHLGAAPAPIVFALLTGAVTIEVAAPMRRWAAGRLAEMEEQIAR